MPLRAARARVFPFVTAKFLNKSAITGATEVPAKEASGVADRGDGMPTRAPGRRARGRSLARYAAWLPPACYLALAIAATWPWLAEPGTTMMAPFGGDVSSSIAKFGAVLESDAIPFVSDRLEAVGFPVGTPTTPGLDLASGFSTAYLWGGSAVAGPIEAHGLLAVLGFFLTATVTYLFVRRVTGSVGAGFVAGVAYGFFPHLYLMAHAATTYTHMWLFVLPMWALWNLSQTPTRRTALIAGLSLIPATFWTPYFTLHAFTVAGACLLVLLALAPRLGIRWGLFGLTLLPWAGAAAAYVLIGAATSFADVPDRPISEFYDQAAHPLMFVWPGSQSIWGDGISQALADRVPRAFGANLYLGLSVLVLAGLGLFAALRAWGASRMRGRPSPQAVAALLGLATVIATGLCSLPPRVLDGSVPTPATLIWEVAPGLRAGQRFVMPMMAGVAVLAGLGAHAVLRRLPVRAVVPVTLAMALVVGVDLYARPPDMIAKVAPPAPAVKTLADAPNAPLVHITPHGFFGGPMPQRPCAMQRVHHKPLVNTCAFTAPPPELWAIALRPMCEALSTLHRRGLRYVLVEPTLPGTMPPNVARCFRRPSPLGRWRVLARDPQTWVFELMPAQA
jgi:hypothetical protein